MSQNWVNDVLVPCILWRLKNANVFDVSMNRLCLMKRKLDLELGSSCIKCRVGYALCWLSNVDMPQFGGAYRFFTLVDNPNSYIEQVVLFYEPKDLNDEWDAFNLSFNQNSTSLGQCSLSKLNIPYDAQEELKCLIERRYSNAAFNLGPISILKPKETFEEVLIKRDLMDDVCLNVASDSIK